MDPITHADKLRHVISELQRYPGQKITGSPDYSFVLCPYHSERTPSGQIFHGAGTRLPGFFLCRGCGTKAKWDDVAPLLNLEPYGKQNPLEDVFSLELLQPTEEKQDRMKFTLSPLPRDKVWRSIKTNLLRKIGCKMLHPEWGAKQIYLPVLVGGELRGYIRSHLKKPTDGSPSHLNKAGSWSKKYGLFPFDYSIKMMKELGSRTVVLVEGPRDALRLISHGIPAMAILGTQSWTDRKAHLLEIHGAERVVIMMDGDDAGIKATEVAKSYLEHVLAVKVIKLWALRGNPYPEYAAATGKRRDQLKSKLWDPGNCPEWVLDRIKDKYF